MNQIIEDVFKQQLWKINVYKLNFLNRNVLEKIMFFYITYKKEKLVYEKK